VERKRLLYDVFQDTGHGLKVLKGCTLFSAVKQHTKETAPSTHHTSIDSLAIKLRGLEFLRERMPDGRDGSVDGPNPVLAALFRVHGTT
jgi:hypothetical protein